MTDAEALAAIGSIGAGSSPGTLTDDQALAAINSIGAAQSNITTPQGVPQPQGAPPQSGQSSLPGAPAIAQEVPMIALGHWLDRTAAGLRQKVSAIPGVGPSIVGGLDSLNNKLGMGQVPSIDPSVQQANEQQYSKLQAANPAGTFIGDALGNVPGRTPLGMAALGALQYGTPAESAIRGATSYLGGKGAEYLAGKIAGGVVGTPAISTNPVRDATIANAQSAGYTFPPVQVNQENPGFINQVLNGFSGKIKTEQQAAIRNQPVTNALARESIGMPPGAPITPEALANVRATAGKAYDAVAQSGSFAPDHQFATDLGTTFGPYMALRGQYPSQANAGADALIADLGQMQPGDAGAAVALVRRLREHGFANIGSADPATKDLGRMQIGAQSAIEDMLDRNLAANGQSDLMQNLQAARQLIAKTYTVQSALDTGTGNVIAGKVGRQLTNGKPLTGGLATVGTMGASFPRVVQNVNSSMPNTSPLSWFAAVPSALEGMHATGDLKGALFGALPFVRPLVRDAILSGPYQRALASVPQATPGLLSLDPARAALVNNAARFGGGLLGATGAAFGR